MNFRNEVSGCIFDVPIAAFPPASARSAVFSPPARTAAGAPGDVPPRPPPALCAAFIPGLHPPRQPRPLWDSVCLCARRPCGVIPEGGQAGRGGQRSGKARSQDPDVSRTTPDAVISGPPRIFNPPGAGGTGSRARRRAPDPQRTGGSRGAARGLAAGGVRWSFVSPRPLVDPRDRSTRVRFMTDETGGASEPAAHPHSCELRAAPSSVVPAYSHITP